MCPNEIKGRLNAFSKGIRRGFEGHDDLAWMIGSYVAHGFHDPKKYPKKPCMVKREIPLKGNDDVKDALMMFADTHNKGVANGGHAGRTTD